MTIVVIAIIAAVLAGVLLVALVASLVSYIKKYRAMSEEDRKFFQPYNLEKEMTETEKRRYIASYTDSTEDMYQKMQAKKKK